MIESVIIEQELQQQLHLLAKETHRTESEIIHESLAVDRHIEALKQRITAADRGEFASKNEVAIFFDVKCKA